MTITIDLPPEQEAKLEALAKASGKNPQAILVDLVAALPNVAHAHALEGGMADSQAAAPRKTTAEILAGWDASGLPSVFARDPADATEIARRLRSQAESRELLK